MTLRSPRILTREGFSRFSPPLQLAEETSRAGNGPTNGFLVGGPSTKLTQKDQDNADEENQRETMRGLVQTWIDSLQLISVITTYFIATETILLGITTPSLTDSGLSTTGQVANLGLMSALVVHAHAAIISFLGSFFLIRYKCAVAEKEEEKAEEEIAENNLVSSPTSISMTESEKARGSRTSPFADDLRTDPCVKVNSPLSGNIWSSNPHLVQVGPFLGQPPTELLERCHSLCLLLSFIGFLLTLIGTITLAWDRLPLSVSISSSVSMGFCLVAGVLTVIIPSTKTSHIYYHHRSH